MGSSYDFCPVVRYPYKMHWFKPLHNDVKERLKALKYLLLEYPSTSNISYYSPNKSLYTKQCKNCLFKNLPRDPFRTSMAWLSLRTVRASTYIRYVTVTTCLSQCFNISSFSKHINQEYKHSGDLCRSSPLMKIFSVTHKAFFGQITQRYAGEQLRA